MDNSAEKMEIQSAIRDDSFASGSDLAPFLAWTPLSRSPWAPKVLPAVTAAALLAALYLTFVVAPDERVMGAVYRILFFHVGAAVSTYLMLTVLLVASSIYLLKREDGWDLAAAAAGTTGFVFATMVLATGMIWGHSAWNRWWNWEPRLVSFLVLWFILFAYVATRTLFRQREEERRFSAVLGIIAAVNVPIVIFSIKLLSHREQLHPEVVGNQGLSDPRYVYGYISGCIAVLLLSALVWSTVFGTKILRQMLIVEQRKS